MEQVCISIILFWLVVSEGNLLIYYFRMQWNVLRDHVEEIEKAVNENS